VESGALAPLFCKNVSLKDFIKKSLVKGDDSRILSVLFGVSEEDSGKMAETASPLVGVDNSLKRKILLARIRVGLGAEGGREQAGEKESEETERDVVGGTSILRRRDALRFSGNNGVDGCESSHDTPILRSPSSSFDNGG